MVWTNAEIACPTKDGKIGINMQSGKNLEAVVGHEITHVLEGTEFYNEMQKALYDYADAKGELQTRRKAIEDLYEGVTQDIDSELTAELVGDYLFTDTDFITRLANDNRNVFQKMFDEIKYMWKQAHPSSPEAAKLEKLKRAFEKAYKESGEVKGDGGTKYSLSETTDGRFVAVVDNDILSNIDTNFWDAETKEKAKKAASEALKKFSDGIVVDGITRKVNRDSRNEYTRSEYSEKLYKRNKVIYADKMRAAEVADDIVFATTNWSRDGKLTHDRNDNFVDFDHGNTLVASGDRKYSAEVVVGIKKNGDAVFYDVVDMTPTEFEIKKENPSTDATTQNAIGIAQEDFSVPIISQNPEKSSVFEKKTFDNDFSAPEGDIIAKFSLSADGDIGPVRDDVKQRKEERINKAYTRIDNKLQQDKIALEEDLATTRADLEQQLADKSAYISNRASELYNELSNLKKGVRASKELGYLLDHGYDWNTLKSTLLKVKRWAGETMNPNSVGNHRCHGFL